MCPLCGGDLRRHGYDRNGQQRVRCKGCGKTGFANEPFRHRGRLGHATESQIKTLLQAGLSTRQIALLLQVGCNTVFSRRAAVFPRDLHEPVGPEDKEHCHYCGAGVTEREFQRRTSKTKHQFCDSDCYQSYYLVTDPGRLARHLERMLNYG